MREMEQVLVSKKINKILIINNQTSYGRSGSLNSKKKQKKERKRELKAEKNCKQRKSVNSPEIRDISPEGG